MYLPDEEPNPAVAKTFFPAETCVRGLPCAHSHCWIVVIKSSTITLTSKLWVPSGTVQKQNVPEISGLAMKYCLHRNYGFHFPASCMVMSAGTLLFTVRFHREKVWVLLWVHQKKRTDTVTKLKPRRLLWSNKRKHASSWPISSRSQAARNCMPSDTSFSFTLVTINSCRSVCL